MNLLFTICGRAGSKGVKGKNLREFCGVPLVWYTLAAISIYKERCLSPSDRLETVLSTDSEELRKLAARVPEPPVFPAAHPRSGGGPCGEGRRDPGLSASGRGTLGDSL